MATEKKQRKRVKLTEGDVFEFTVPDGRLGYGIIIKRGGLKNGGTPYIAIFRSLFDVRPKVDLLVQGEVALAGWTMDALVYHGQWRVIAQDLSLPSIPLPNFKVGQEGKTYVTDVNGDFIGEATAAEQELLNFQFSRAPIGFQRAFEAIHGFSAWREDYEKLTPAYGAARVTRPT